MRGLVVPLTPADVVQRALYLAGEAHGSKLDPFVREPAAVCPVASYMLREYNGGKDPQAPHPFARWRTDDGLPMLTADCMGGAAWCSGFDRYQPRRFLHIYAGWINTDSMIQDALGPAKCFEALGRPSPGALIVCRSGSPGHRIGHVGVIVDVPAEWLASARECWDAIGVVDVAARRGRANRRTTGRGWFGSGAVFVRSLMRP